jgi:hypothetical protein
MHIFAKLAAAAAVTLSLAAMPATAAPLQLGDAQIQNAQVSFGINIGNGDRRFFQRRGSNYFYNGHRGYRDFRPGYLRYNGFWFPRSAFSINLNVDRDRDRDWRGRDRDRNWDRGGNRGVSARHVAWCEDNYRSYRRSDNSFQPYNGPRRECVSPYSR